MAKQFLSTNTFCRQLFGCKVYKLSVSAATTCPNRDGTVSYGGCSFCSAGGSGDFAASAKLPLDQQILQAKRILGEKGNGCKYIAYFQSFTGTHGDLTHLEQIYTEAALRENIACLSIATRPDCLGKDAMAMLERLSRIKPLWVELGLQTIHADTFNRGYPLRVYDEAMEKLASLPVHRITHVILGLPGESREQMLETVSYVGQRTDGIKLQLLHILRGTEMEKKHNDGIVSVMEPEEYYDLLAACLDILPESVVVHRMTGDGVKKDLIAPLWTGNKKRVLADLNRVLSARGISVGTMPPNTYGEKE